MKKQRHGNIEQTGNYRRGGGRRGMEEGKGRDQLKNMYEWLMDMNKESRGNCGQEGWAGWQRIKGKNIGTTLIE